MRTQRRLATGVPLVLALGLGNSSAAIGSSPSATSRLGAAPARASVSLHASSNEVSSGGSVTLTGTLRGAAAAGSRLAVRKSPYPFRSSKLVTTIAPRTNGSFSIAVKPDRDTRYTVRLARAGPQAEVQVDVSEMTITKLRALPLGQALVTLVVFHPRDLAWAGATVRWSFASGPHGRFSPAPPTRAFKPSQSAIVLRTQVALPAGPYRFRVCFHAAGDRALSNGRRPPGCTGRGYHGAGTLPAGFPSVAALTRAGAYLVSRTGRAAFAVLTPKVDCRASAYTESSPPRASSRRCSWSPTCVGSTPTASGGWIPPARRSCTR